MYYSLRESTLILFACIIMGIALLPLALIVFFVSIIKSRIKKEPSLFKEEALRKLGGSIAFTHKPSELFLRFCLCDTCRWADGDKCLVGEVPSEDKIDCNKYCP